MKEELTVKKLDQVVVRFSGDSGDGMQLAVQTQDTKKEFHLTLTTSKTGQFGLIFGF